MTDVVYRPTKTIHAITKKNMIINIYVFLENGVDPFYRDS